MEASPTKVIQYFNGEKQNLIPLFQRPYIWNEKNWEIFWDDLMVQYEDDEPGNHFMGAIVSVPARSVPVGVNKHLIIDGQQRLTTVSLLLCALRDCLESLDSNKASLIQEVYLTNRFRDEDDTLKFVPTQVDRDIYRRIVLDREVPPKPNSKENAIQISAVYHFFKDKLLKSKNSNEYPIDLAKVLQTLVHKLEVVMINLAENEDPYLIFESLNFKGVPLTQADLVRNHLLMCFKHSIAAGGKQEQIYKKYWVPLENSLKSDELTEFLRHYIMKGGTDVKKNAIYTAIKEKLKNKKPKEVEAEIKSLQTVRSLIWERRKVIKSYRA